jgi:hypothetical protein
LIVRAARDNGDGLAYLVAAPVNARARLLAELQRSHVGDWAAVRERVSVPMPSANARFVVSWNRGWHPRRGRCRWLDRGRVFTFSAVGPAFDLSRLRLTRVAGPALVETVDRIALASAALSPARLPARARIRALAQAGDPPISTVRRRALLFRVSGRDQERLCAAARP